jgi:hypothetical protein
MNNSTYKAMTFSLNVTDGSGAKYTHTVHPSFDGITIKKAKESGECYFKETCSNKFYFKNEEFNLLYGYGIYAKFTLVIKKNGVEITRGEFRLTDCEVDANRKIITTSITIDKYAKLSKNKGTEYNLTKLKPATEIINYDIRACVQIYVAGSTKVEQFAGKIHNEVSVSAIDVTPSLYTDIFLIVNMVQVVGAGYTPIEYHGFRGMITLSSIFDTKLYFISTDNLHKLEYKLLLKDPDNGDYSIDFQFRTWTRASVSSEWIIDYPGITGNNPFMSHNIYMMANKMGSMDGKEYNSSSFVVFYRSLTSNQNSYGYNKLVDDNLFHSELYSGCANLYGISIYAGVVQSTNVSQKETSYGIIEGTDTYYDSPSTLNNPVPIYQEAWADGISYWVDADFMENNKVSTSINNQSLAKSIGDFYRIGSVIKKLLEKVDDEIIFDEDEAHSQFLFRETNPITKNWQCPQYITQKSNILTLSYNRAAWKVPCTLEKIFEFLKYAFNCYYDIYLDNDGNKHLRIEHVIFYENGLCYDENNQLSTIDAGAIVSPYNGKKSSYMSKNWKYDTTTQASTIELSWMDKQSDYFDGSSIETKKEDNIYSEEKTDKKQITFFSSDIDFLILDTSAADKDGFLVVQPNPTDPHKVPTSASVNGYQNYLLAFSTLVPNFLLYYLYQKHVTFNDNVLSVVRRKKMKTSELEINIPKGGDIGEYTIIKTEIGDGTIESVETDYSCNHCKIELKYETE